jgi:hypothetical protein
VQYPLLYACYLVLVVLHVICHVSINRCNQFFIPAIKTILYLLQRQYTTNVHERTLADDIPGSIQTITSHLVLQPPMKSFLCCRSCFSCYNLDSYPINCTYQSSHDSQPCGRPLLKSRKRKGSVVNAEDRKLHCQEFSRWLGNLLWRHGMEELLDRDVYQTGAGPGELWDIWDGEVLRNFEGPEGGNFIRNKNPGEGRLLFSLCMDNFNPFFNKAGGKVYSAGAIALICLNLPGDMRHLLENMFVFCVFPGPKEPSLEQINNVIRPLVDDFIGFWSPGVYYRSTPSHPEGRLFRAAIVLLLGDLLAARKMSGINQWCTQCPLAAADMDNLELETWPKPLTCEEHRKLAEEWKALDNKGRQKHFGKHGIRYSELLRLPYWDPVRFTAVELSHNLLSNNAERHLRVLFRMNVHLEDGVDEQETPLAHKRKQVDPDAVNEVWDTVLHGTNRQLQNTAAYLLREFCRMANMSTGGRKGHLLRQIFEWVCLFIY